MATDWAADVKKYAPDADDGVIAGIVRYCGIALRNRDSSLVSFTDPKELDRVRNNFLKKKLGLTQADKTLDAAIAKIGEVMKADRTRNRVTVYYLLAAHFRKLALFAPKAKAKAPAKPKAPAKAAALTTRKAPPAAKKTVATAKKAAPAKKPPAKAAAPAQALASPAPPPAAPAAAAPKAAGPTPAAASAGDEDSGLGWLWWVLGLALLLSALWWLFGR